MTTFWQGREGHFRSRSNSRPRAVAHALLQQLAVPVPLSLAPPRPLLRFSFFSPAPSVAVDVSVLLTPTALPLDSCSTAPTAPRPARPSGSSRNRKSVAVDGAVEAGSLSPTPRAAIQERRPLRPRARTLACCWPALLAMTTYLTIADGNNASSGGARDMSR